MTFTHPRSTFRRLATVILLALLGTLAAALTAGPAYADGTVVTGNKNCAELIPGSKELKVEPPADGTFSNPDGFSVTVDVRTLAADDPQHAGDQTGSQVFDFTATGGTVLGVAVKGGPDVNFYDYRPDGVSSGTGLHAPVNPTNQKFSGLSHISFCYKLPTTTPTPSQTPTPSGSTPGTPSSPGTSSGGGGGGGGGELPVTGIAVGTIVALGAALIGGGLGLMLLRRRRDKFVA